MINFNYTYNRFNKKNLKKNNIGRINRVNENCVSYRHFSTDSNPHITHQSLQHQLYLENVSFDFINAHLSQITSIYTNENLSLKEKQRLVDGLRPFFKTGMLSDQEDSSIKKSSLEGFVRDSLSNPYLDDFFSKRFQKNPDFSECMAVLLEQKALPLGISKDILFNEELFFLYLVKCLLSRDDFIKNNKISEKELINLLAESFVNDFNDDLRDMALDIWFKNNIDGYLEKSIILKNKYNTHYEIKAKSRQFFLELSNDVDTSSSSVLYRYCHFVFKDLVTATEADNINPDSMLDEIKGFFQKLWAVKKFDTQYSRLSYQEFFHSYFIHYLNLSIVDTYFNALSELKFTTISVDHKTLPLDKVIRKAYFFSHENLSFSFKRCEYNNILYFYIPSSVTELYSELCMLSFYQQAVPQICTPSKFEDGLKDISFDMMNEEQSELLEQMTGTRDYKKLFRENINRIQSKSYKVNGFALKLLEEKITQDFLQVKSVNFLNVKINRYNKSVTEFIDHISKRKLNIQIFHDILMEGVELDWEPLVLNQTEQTFSSIEEMFKELLRTRAYIMLDIAECNDYVSNVGLASLISAQGYNIYFKYKLNRDTLEWSPESNYFTSPVYKNLLENSEKRTFSKDGIFALKVAISHLLQLSTTKEYDKLFEEEWFKEIIEEFHFDNDTSEVFECIFKRVYETPLYQCRDRNLISLIILVKEYWNHQRAETGRGNTYKSGLILDFYEICNKFQPVNLAFSMIRCTFTSRKFPTPFSLLDYFYDKETVQSVSDNFNKTGLSGVFKEMLDTTNYNQINLLLTKMYVLYNETLAHNIRLPAVFYEHITRAEGETEEGYHQRHMHHLYLRQVLHNASFARSCIDFELFDLSKAKLRKVIKRKLLPFNDRIMRMMTTGHRLPKLNIPRFHALLVNVLYSTLGFLKDLHSHIFIFNDFFVNSAQNGFDIRVRTFENALLPGFPDKKIISSSSHVSIDTGRFTYNYNFAVELNSNTGKGKNNFNFLLRSFKIFLSSFHRLVFFDMLETKKQSICMRLDKTIGCHPNDVVGVYESIKSVQRKLKISDIPDICPSRLLIILGRAYSPGYFFSGYTLKSVAINVNKYRDEGLARRVSGIMHQNYAPLLSSKRSPELTEKFGLDRWERRLKIYFAGLSNSFISILTHAYIEQIRTMDKKNFTSTDEKAIALINNIPEKFSDFTEFRIIKHKYSNFDFKSLTAETKGFYVGINEEPPYEEEGEYGDDFEEEEEEEEEEEGEDKEDMIEYKLGNHFHN